MSYFEDLTPHTYEPYYPPTSGQAVLNVGWLDEACPFPVGETSLKFREALRELCRNPVLLHRGHQECQFCPREDRDTWHRRHPERLGNGQIRVMDRSGVWYAAPAMVHHYVVEHEYLPPAEFIGAVLDPARVADEE